jgi:hypothetical protein
MNRKFMEEATRLAIESVEKGWGGPFGAVIVKDGEIIGARAEPRSAHWMPGLPRRDRGDHRRFKPAQPKDTAWQRLSRGHHPRDDRAPARLA